MQLLRKMRKIYTFKYFHAMYNDFYTFLKREKKIYS